MLSDGNCGERVVRIVTASGYFDAIKDGDESWIVVGFGQYGEMELDWDSVPVG